MLRHIGLTHVGASWGINSSVLLLCHGKIIPPTPKYSASGIKAYLDECIFSSEGRLYVANTRVNYLAQGIKALLVKEIYPATAELVRPFVGNHYVTGFKAMIPSSSYLISKGSCIAIHSSHYILAGACSRLFKQGVGLMTGLSVHGYKSFFDLTGFSIFGKHTRFMITAAFNRSNHSKYAAHGTAYKRVRESLIVQGGLSRIGKSTYWAKGAIQRSKRFCAKVGGRLVSNNVTQRFKLKGLVTTVAYIASVPVRFQKFITDKRWFR